MCFIFSAGPLYDFHSRRDTAVAPSSSSRDCCYSPVNAYFEVRGRYLEQYFSARFIDVFFCAHAALHHARCLLIGSATLDLGLVSHLEHLGDPRCDVAEVLARVHDDAVHRAVVGLEAAVAANRVNASAPLSVDSEEGSSPCHDVLCVSHGRLMRYSANSWRRWSDTLVVHGNPERSTPFLQDALCSASRAAGDFASHPILRLLQRKASSKDPNARVTTCWPTRGPSLEWRVCQSCTTQQVHAWRHQYAQSFLLNVYHLQM